VSSLSLGTASITATCDGTVSASVSAQVTPVPVASVSITPNGFSLPDNTQGQLTAVARDSANNVLSLQGRQVIWNSSNLPVATVSNQGVVSASNPGTTEITVSVDGVTSAPVVVTVTLFFETGGQQLQVGAALENRPAVAADHLAAKLRQVFRPADITRR
jgi:hypothetical protein